MLDNIKWLGHSTIKLLGNRIIYIDPYNIKDELHDADYIFITHSHYDHYSEVDLKKCLKEDTKVIVTTDLLDKVINLGLSENNIISVLPNNIYSLEDLNFRAIPSYNINKNYHPKSNNWVGYVINYNKVTYYVAGDTDNTPEAQKVKCNVAFLPIGGTFTMTAEEAAELANIIKPKIVIPIHYGTIVGTMDDAITFKNLVNEDINCEI